MSRYSKKIRNLIKDEIKDMIMDYEDVYGCDLAYEMYNNDYYIIGTYKAKQFLKEYFDDMTECLEQYEEEIGEAYPGITNPEKLATLLALYVAQDVLCESKTLSKCWDCRLTEENLEAIKEELYLWFVFRQINRM